MTYYYLHYHKPSIEVLVLPCNIFWVLVHTVLYACIVVCIVPIVYFVCKKTDVISDIYRNIKRLLFSLQFFCEQTGHSQCVCDFSVITRGRDDPNACVKFVVHV